MEPDAPQPEPGPSGRARIIDEAEASRILSPENILRLTDLIRPEVEPGKRKLVYVLPASGRIGHLAQEPHALHCLYGADFDEIIVVLQDRRKLPVSEGVLETASQHVRFVETGDVRIVELGHFDAGTVDGGAVTVLLASALTLLEDMLRRFTDSPPPPFLPPPAMQARGAAWLEGMGIAADTPIVTVHVRDAGHLPEMRYHEYRGASVANYHDAVRVLLDSGHVVFRIGDAGGPRFGFDDPRVIDVPFLDGYADWMDVYLIWKSRFMLGCCSGPEAVARVLGVPLLKVNAITENFVWYNANDLLVFKHYWSDAEQRRLSYREILGRRLSWVSQAWQLAEQHVRLIENTPDEIAAAVSEMLRRLDGSYDPDPAIDERFHALGREFADSIPALMPPNNPYLKTNSDMYALASPLARLSHAFSRMHPAFLGSDRT